MKVIHKDHLEIEPDIQVIAISKGGKFLTAHEQFGHIAVWKLTDPDEAEYLQPMQVVPTGYPPREDAEYFTTVFLRGGSLVYHIFLIKKE